MRVRGLIKELLDFDLDLPVKVARFDAPDSLILYNIIGANKIGEWVELDYDEEEG